MSQTSTFIKLDRNILRWGWYTDPVTKSLFIHLILKANFEDRMWLNKKIERGQLVTSRKILASELGLTESKVRTALEHLKSTGEISVKTQSKYSIITINNYSKFQGKRENNRRQKNNSLCSDNHKKEEQFAGKSPTNRQQIATTKEYKNNKNVKKRRYKKTFSPSPPEKTEVINFCREKNFSFDWEKFYYHYCCVGWTVSGAPVTDWKALAYKWQATERKGETNGEKEETSYDIETLEKFSLFD